MSNLQTLEATSSRGVGGIKNGEPSNLIPNLPPQLELHEFFDEAPDDLSSFGSTFFASEDDLPIDFASSHPPESTGNNLKRKSANSNHKGVHFRKKNKKFASRLCLPGGNGRKLELGEYNTHEEAARAYLVGAFYYNKPGTSNCGEDHSFLETLPCVPDNLSDADKSAWVRERARHSATSMERRGICSSKRVLESGGSSFDARPGTPASYGTESSCDDYHSTPTTQTTSNGLCAEVNWFNWLYGMVDGGGEDQVDSLFRVPGDVLNNRHKGEFAAQRRNSNAFYNKAPVVDNQGVPLVKFSKCFLSALNELGNQGWECTLKPRSSPSMKTGVLFSVPKGQHVAPALRITDKITDSFREIREEGWEVHLQPLSGGDGELES